MKIVFATHNNNKLKEVAALLPNIELLSLTDIGCTEEIPETADTLEGNAKIKANHVTEKYGYPCFADDTGLLVDALNGEPGVYSARYAGEHGNAEKNMDLLLKNLEGTSNRKACFKTIICLNLNNQQHLFEGICNGNILEKRQGDEGFGYDPIFTPNGYQLSFAEMSLDEKGKISHRGLAVQKLIAFLQNL
ncbi:non-canonical purine NTP pyrophosphatase [Wenyingzhuangia fucanilytica]|uniref:dITP/XTP pyrophosphatase n=1 Tax=Wenyingzhuangia fucanilytica TaxID=1790137 RepID=A0A1B1Y458_9FLAO|nr:non-canonical purine NTP diphosphatase [Wenyingzhuangia fucanilytica]ANW95538.1 non-canonical purine NTP pyrophosphatase [Wenyingzhuangia fucanilytica]